MVMIPHNPSCRSQVDLSFLYSLECDLACPFCMYGSGPEAQKKMSLVAASRFIETIQTSDLADKIHCFGFYGGEPSLHLEAYETIAAELPEGPQRFTITNGTWSRGSVQTLIFLEWAKRRNIQIHVSRTPYHRRFQDEAVLQQLAADGKVILKDPDQTFIPMGRLAKGDWTCGYRCQTDQRSRRMGILPSGDVMLQSCDGVYPIFGHIREGFPALYRKATHGEWSCPKLVRHL